MNGACTMNIRIPEKHKIPGVCYAVTDDGLELPVVDVTHPAFACVPTDAEIEAVTQDFVRGAERRRKMPAFVKKVFLWYLQRKSILVRSYKESQAPFVTGMTIYYFKLGPENLGEGYATKIDRQFASALPCLSVRLRLKDMARMMAEALIPLLMVRQHHPLHLLNIGGGPATDSLNTLLVLQKSHPHLLKDRTMVIHCLDLDQEGPGFGARSLEALKAAGGPLNGLQISFQYSTFNWSNPRDLIPVLERIPSEAIVTGTSEGGIFDYCSDDEILATLELLWRRSSDDFVMTGTITRADGLLSGGVDTGHLTLKPRNLADFKGLVQRAGWSVAEASAQPFCHDVLLRKCPSTTKQEPDRDRLAGHALA